MKGPGNEDDGHAGGQRDAEPEDEDDGTADEAGDLPAELPHQSWHHEIAHDQGEAHDGS